MITRNLNYELEQSFMNLGIDSEQKNSLTTFLNVVKLRDVPTWEHEVRVGLKGMEVITFTKTEDPKALFYPGLLHDTGKCLSDPRYLKKTEGFNEKDMAEMQKHVLHGYEMLRGIHDFSASVLLYHHWFQGNRSYPKVLPKPNIDYSRGTGLTIAYCGRLLGLVDFYDAVTFRRNDKFGEVKQKTPEEIKALMLAHNVDKKFLIEKLYDAGIFGGEKK